MHLRQLDTAFYEILTENTYGVPSEDTHVQAVRGTLEAEHSEAFVDIILVFRPLICRVCQIGVWTSVDICIE